MKKYFCGIVWATLGLWFMAATANGQEIAVHGKVINAQNSNPLPGVNVTVKGTTKGATTNKDGTFKLAVPSSNDTLVFSFVGFKRRNILLNGRSDLGNIKLKEKVIKGQKAVVTAFGEEKNQEDVIGAVTTINPEEMAEVPTSNLTQTLAGRAAGIIAFQRSGEPGRDNAKFFVRGVTSFGYKKDPLILIDGIESSNTALARLQPDNIKSFSILKDATATAVYGSRAANGVILVKTKEGHRGKAKVGVRLENSFSMPTENIDFANPVRYMKLYNDAVASREPSSTLPFSQEKIDKTSAGTNPYLYPATNWKEDLFKDYTMNQRFHLDISGGGDVAHYYVAGAVNQDHGMLKVDPLNNYNNNIDLKSYSLRTNVGVQLMEHTNMDFKLSGFFDDYTGPLSTGGTIYNEVVNTSPVRYPAKYPRTERYQYVKHTLFGNYNGDGNGYKQNPYADMVKGYRNYSTTDLNAQFGVNHHFASINSLDFSARLFLSRHTHFEVSRSITPYWYHATATPPGSPQKYNLNLLNEDEGNPTLGYDPSGKTVNKTFKVRSKLTYNHTFEDKHEVGGLLVFRLRNYLTGNPATFQESLPQRNLGVSGEASYNYDKRYYVKFNFGYNGSERFDKNHRYGFFPSLGVAYNVSNENFWKPLSNVISNLKFRATYGLVGNDAIGSPANRFLYLSVVNIRDDARSYTFGRDRGESLPGVSISRYPNSKITWEQATKIDVGIRLGLFNQFTLKADYYKQNRDNILQTRASIPPSIGLSSDPSANIGKAKNHGIDGSIQYSKFFNKKIFLKLRGNFTYATSEYTQYEENEYKNAPWKSHVGNSLSQQYGYIAERLFVDDEEAVNTPKQTFGEYGGGDIKYRDVNNDGQITQLDQVPIGYPTNPEIVYGFGFTFGIKNFDLSAFFQGSARESFWIGEYATAPFVNNHQLLKAYANNHWSQSNQDQYALWPRFSANNSEGNNNNFQQSTWFMRDGSFLRLKQLEIGYNLSQDLLQSLSMRNLRIYINGTNLITWSKFKLWDPEMAGNGLGYPLQRVFNIGVKASF